MTDWPAIVGRHKSAVWQTAYRLLGNRADASDCFQETFLSALDLSGRQRVRNWSALLMRVCTCRAMDELRRRHRRADRRDDVADFSAVASPNPGPGERVLAAELSERLRLALAALPGRQAEVFCMRCLNDLSYRQIASQLGIKTSAVGVLLHRARWRLRELLSPTVATEDVEVKP